MTNLKRKNRKSKHLKRNILKKDNSETDLDGQPGPVNQARSTKSGQPGPVNQVSGQSGPVNQGRSERGHWGGRAILVCTWLCSVANNPPLGAELQWHLVEEECTVGALNAKSPQSFFLLLLIIWSRHRRSSYGFSPYFACAKLYIFPIVPAYS